MNAAASSYVPPPPPSSSFGSAPMPAGEPIPNYLWQSIVVTLCCCLPLGIVGIIFAAQVNSFLAQGDVASARDASRKAKMFLMIGAIIGLVSWILGGFFFGASFYQAWQASQTS